MINILDAGELGSLIGIAGTAVAAEVAVTDAAVVVFTLPDGAYTLKPKGCLVYAEAFATQALAEAFVAPRGEEIPDGVAMSFVTAGKKYVAVIAPTGASGTLRMNAKAKATLKQG